MTTRKIIETDARKGFEVAETSAAKDEVANILYLAQEDIEDELGLADDIIERIIALGWRPTQLEGGNSNG